MQQTTSADDIFRYIFFLGALSVKQYCLVGCDLCPNCLQKLSADDTRRHRVTIFSFNPYLANSEKVSFKNGTDPDKASFFILALFSIPSVNKEKNLNNLIKNGGVVP